MQHKASLTEGPVGRSLIRLTLPMIGGAFSIVAFNLADTYFVGQLGKAPLAAMGFTMPVVFIVASIALGLGVGAASVISRAIGKGNVQRVRRLTTDAMFLALVIVAMFLTAGLLTIDATFRMLGADAETLPLIRQYMEVWYFGMLFVVIPMIGNNALRASGDTLTPGLIMLIAAALNIILDPLLIFGLWGFPRLGLAGAAWATVFSRMVTMIASLSILHFRKGMLTRRWPGLRTLGKSWKAILYVGLPAAATNILTPLSGAVVIRVLSDFGEAAVAGAGAGMRVQAFVMLVPMAMSSVLVPFIGQNWGAGKTGRALRALKLSQTFAMVWGGVCLAVMLLAGRVIAAQFSDSPDVVEAMEQFLWITPIAYGLVANFQLALAAFNAINRPLVSAAMNLLRMVVLYVPLAYVASLLWGYDGVFIGIVVANCLSGGLAGAAARRVLHRGHAEAQFTAATIPQMPEDPREAGIG